MRTSAHDCSAFVMRTSTRLNITHDSRRHGTRLRKMCTYLLMFSQTQKVPRCPCATPLSYQMFPYSSISCLFLFLSPDRSAAVHNISVRQGFHSPAFIRKSAVKSLPGQLTVNRNTGQRFHSSAMRFSGPAHVQRHPPEACSPSPGPDLPEEAC